MCITSIAVAPSGNVYATDDWDMAHQRLQYFTPTGSFLGKWGSAGSGNGQFYDLRGIAIAPNGNVYVADMGNDRIQYFTPAGSFLGKWGGLGSKKGQFWCPWDVGVSPEGKRVYVADRQNHRIQYFRWTETAIVTTSLGRVKALFK